MALATHGDQFLGVYCNPCQMWLASVAQFDDHCKGKKHRRRAHGGLRPSPSQLRAAQEAAAQALLV
eukprot:8567499-Lingulodinium_polyedra.AAC.1